MQPAVSMPGKQGSNGRNCRLAECNCCDCLLPPRGADGVPGVYLSSAPAACQADGLHTSEAAKGCTPQLTARPPGRKPPNQQQPGSQDSPRFPVAELEGMAQVGL
jgi:hypothetical protein